MFEQANVETRNALGEWILRGGVAILFILFGAKKFSSGPRSHWVDLFQEMGAGQWFRYLTGVVEVLGALAAGGGLKSGRGKLRRASFYAPWNTRANSAVPPRRSSGAISASFRKISRS